MEELRAIANYIAGNYGSADKIVEVGVGKVPETMRELRRLLPRCQLVVTDIEEPEELPEGVKLVRDDVTEPNVQIYEDASLVYSIRPPSELQPSLFKIARKVGADLLIKPIAGEEVLEGGELANYERATFHLFRAERG